MASGRLGTGSQLHGGLKHTSGIKLIRWECNRCHQAMRKLPNTYPERCECGGQWKRAQEPGKGGANVG